jgi:siroheme synthase
MTTESNDPSTPADASAPAGKAERARAALLTAIDAQMKANDPPETLQTLVRLMEAGHSREQAMKLIASALIAEVTNVLRENSTYDRDRYVANLQRLPKLPWEKDESAKK